MHLFEVCLCSGCLFLLTLFLICAIGITCINIDPVFYLASLLLGLGTAGVDAVCLYAFSVCAVAQPDWVYTVRHISILVSLPTA